MTEPQPSPRRFALGSFPLACGDTLDDAQIDYRVFGELNAERSNLVLYPSSYGAWPEDLAWAVGPILDPSRLCVVLVSQFGNGRSSSPSNGGPPLGAGAGRSIIATTCGPRSACWRRFSRWSGRP